MTGPRLRTPRSRPLRVPEDYVPQFPSFVARHPESVSRLVMAYLGGEGELDGPDGPRHHDRAVGDGETVTTAFWGDPAAFDRWAAAHRAARLAAPGHWLEVAAPGVERYETIFGMRSRPEGDAALAEGFSGAARTGPTPRPSAATGGAGGGAWRTWRAGPSGTVLTSRSSAPSGGWPPPSGAASICGSLTRSWWSSLPAAT